MAFEWRNWRNRSGEGGGGKGMSGLGIGIVQNGGKCNEN